MNLMCCEQRMQAAFGQLLGLHCSEKDKADCFLTKSWESYWRRMKLTDWLERTNKGWKNKEIT